MACICWVESVIFQCGLVLYLCVPLAGILIMSRSTAITWTYQTWISPTRSQFSWLFSAFTFFSVSAHLKNLSISRPKETISTLSLFLNSVLLIAWKGRSKSCYHSPGSVDRMKNIFAQRFFFTVQLFGSSYILVKVVSWLVFFLSFTLSPGGYSHIIKLWAI